jgi:hypothetical protein
VVGHENGLFFETFLWDDAKLRNKFPQVGCRLRENSTCASFSI